MEILTISMISTLLLGVLRTHMDGRRIVVLRDAGLSSLLSVVSSLARLFLAEKCEGRWKILCLMQCSFIYGMAPALLFSLSFSP